jgi:hypothetical protein
MAARAFEQARSGPRQLVLVTSPVIGKSAIADAFLEQVHTARTSRIAHGQCLNHHGIGEADLPLIEALRIKAASFGECGHVLLRLSCWLLADWAPASERSVPWVC